MQVTPSFSADQFPYPIQTRTRGSVLSREQRTTGVLVLHGFTSSLDSVRGIVPFLAQEGLDYEMPILRGHGSKPEDLIGVVARDWYEDSLLALERLASRVDAVVVLGLSMGGLMALNLCARPHAFRHKICACVTWAAALGFVNPLSHFVKYLSPVFRMWPGQESFNDAQCRKKNTNYRTFPTRTFGSLQDFSRETRGILGSVSVPLCIIHSKRDQVVPYSTANLLFDSVASSHCVQHTLSRSGHELGQDCEAETVFALSMRFIRVSALVT